MAGIDRAFVVVVDEHLKNMMIANSKEPYVHAEYSRHLDMARAALVLLTKGDMPYARALERAFHDSGEDMDRYLSQGHFSRDELVCMVYYCNPPYPEA